jgi:hypothetical protein
MNRNGLRHAGGTDITKCCGDEAIIPQKDHRDWNPHETEDGIEITESNFPDAELVCASCGRTWGDGCEHNDIDVDTDSVEFHQSDGQQGWAVGTCNECDDTVDILLEVTDVR